MRYSNMGQIDDLDKARDMVLQERKISRRSNDQIRDWALRVWDRRLHDEFYKRAENERQYTNAVVGAGLILIALKLLIEEDDDLHER